jgi:hypothetical protein
MARLFISHASADRAVVEREFLPLFRALGFETWFAEDDIQTSEQWERSIHGGLKTSKWFVLILSPRSAASEWVKDEIAWAIDERPDFIVPILIEDCELRDFHIRLPRIQFVDFRNDTSESRNRLIKLLIDAEYKPFFREIDTTDQLKRRSKEFWAPLVDEGLQIVLGRFREFQPFEQSGFVGVGDAAAMMELQTHFESLGLSGVPVSYADRLDGDALKTNLIVLGGPDANLLTREAVGRISTTLKFGDPDRHVIALYDSAEDHHYVPRQGRSGGIENDFGIFFLSSNPFAPKRRMLLGAGSFGYGTWACVRFVHSDEFLNNSLVASGADIECLIETDVLWETPQHVKVHALREL